MKGSHNEQRFISQGRLSWVCVIHSFLSENPEYEPCLFLSLGGRKKLNELPGILAGGVSTRMGDTDGAPSEEAKGTGPHSVRISFPTC